MYNAKITEEFTNKTGHIKCPLSQ